MPELWLKAFLSRHRGNERVGGTPLCFECEWTKNTGSEVAPLTLSFSPRITQMNTDQAVYICVIRG